jgi:hypothetical protein
MFLRYTHLGVGHPVALRRVVRDCFGLLSTMVNSGGMGVDQGQAYGECREEDNDEQMDVDQVGEEVSDDESDEEEFDSGDDQDLGDEFDAEIEEISNDLSF